MSRHAVVVFINDGDADVSWAVGYEQGGEVLVMELTTAEQQGLEAQSRSLERAIKEKGLTGSEAMIAIPSRLCLAAVIETGDLPRRKRRGPLLYRLEEQLPWPAESVVADFVEQPNRALGVAVETDAVRPIIEAVETAGLNVQAICPTALLTAQHLVRRTDQANWDALAIAQEDKCDCITLSPSGPTAWRQTQYTQLSIEQTFRTLAFSDGMETDAIGLLCEDDDFAEVWTGNIPGAERIGGAPRPRNAASECGLDILRGAVRPWLNLRRDALSPTDRFATLSTPLNTAVISLLIFLAALPLALQWRTHAYRDLAGELRDEQRTAYTSVFDGRVPADVVEALDQKHRSANSLSGSSSDLPDEPSALITLYEALRRLPTDQRYRVLELRVDAGSLQLEGEARSHSEADQIVAALRKQQGFDMAPPRTEQLKEKGVGFTATGRLSPSANKQDSQVIKAKGLANR